MPSPGCMRSATKQSAADTSSRRLNRFANCLTSVRSQTQRGGGSACLGRFPRAAARLHLAGALPSGCARATRPRRFRDCGSDAVSIHAPIDSHVRGRVAQELLDGISEDHALRQRSPGGAEPDQARAVLARAQQYFFGCIVGDDDTRVEIKAVWSEASAELVFDGSHQGATFGQQSSGASWLIKRKRGPDTSRTKSKCRRWRSLPSRRRRGSASAAW